MPQLSLHHGRLWLLGAGESQSPTRALAHSGPLRCPRLLLWSPGTGVRSAEGRGPGLGRRDLQRRGRARVGTAAATQLARRASRGHGGRPGHAPHCRGPSRHGGHSARTQGLQRTQWAAWPRTARQEGPSRHGGGHSAGTHRASRGHSGWPGHARHGRSPQHEGAGQQGSRAASRPGALASLATPPPPDLSPWPPRQCPGSRQGAALSLDLCCLRHGRPLPQALASHLWASQHPRGSHSLTVPSAWHLPAPLLCPTAAQGWSSSRLRPGFNWTGILSLLTLARTDLPMGGCPWRAALPPAGARAQPEAGQLPGPPDMPSAAPTLLLPGGLALAGESRRCSPGLPRARPQAWAQLRSSRLEQPGPQEGCGASRGQGRSPGGAGRLRVPTPQPAGLCPPFPHHCQEHQVLSLCCQSSWGA